MNKLIAILPGDGIGPEVMVQAQKVLAAIARIFHHKFTYEFGDIGGAAFSKYSTHFPQQTQVLCERADAILFGSVGGAVHEAHLTRWQNCEKNSILALRKTLQLAINLRPCCVYPALQAISPLKNSIIDSGIDILILRELIGDVYFGEHKQFTVNNLRYATDIAEYNEQQIAVAARRGFELAAQRRCKVTSVDKANVLDTSKLWRKVVSEIAAEYPQISCEHMLVDNCAMQLIINPTQFDVIITANLFGDILSDAAAAIPGSLGLIPSASLSASGRGLYEPAGGSAPDIAGKNIANPIAQILSAALLLRHSFALNKEAAAIETAVQNALEADLRTQDIFTVGTQLVGTAEMGNAIIEYIIKNNQAIS